MKTINKGFSQLYLETPSRVAYTSNVFRPLIAGHRGMAGILPENTKESFLACLYEGSDFVELDVVLTKDNQVLVAHDTYLSRVSNVMDFPEFQDRKQIRMLENKEKDDWWVCDFTVMELRTLGIKQTLHSERLQIFDFKFTFPTLDEVIQTVKHFNRTTLGLRNPDKGMAGILLEIKDTHFHTQYLDMEISERVHEVLMRHNIDSVSQARLECPIVIMSFESEILRYFEKHCNLPRIYLVWKLQQLQSLNLIRTFADGIGIDLKLLWDKFKDQPSPLVDKLRSKGFLIYSWTIQDDNKRKMEWMNAKNSNELYFKLVRVLRLDGIITEFPEKAINIVQMLREQEEFQDESVIKSTSSSLLSNVSSPHSRKNSF